MEDKKVNSQIDRYAKLRQQAEAVLSNVEKPSLGELSVDNVHQLIAELQIHQIELEMQNDELRKTQTQLAAEREKYADLYNFAPVAYFTLDDNDIIQELNLAAAELLGHEPKYLKQRPIAPYLPPESLEKFIQHRRIALETHTSQTCELTLRRRNKTHAIVQVHTVMIKNDSFGLPLWRSVMIDVTEQKKAEMELAFHASLLEQVHNGVIAIDFNNTILYWNRFAEELYQWTREEAIGKNIIDLLSPEEMKETVQKNFADLKRKGQWEGDFSVQRKDGSTVPTHITNTYLKDADGQNVGFIGISVDVTERQQAMNALRASELRYRTLFENAVDGVVIVDPDGHLVAANESFARMHGYSVEEILKLSLFDLDAQENRKLHTERMEHVLSGQPLRFEVEHVHKDGHQFPLSVSANYTDINGFPFIIGFHQDITERKRADVRLKESEEKFRKLVREMPVGILLQGPQAEILLSNSIALDMLGLSEDQLLGKTSFDPDWNVIREDGSPFPGNSHPVPQAISTRQPVLNVVMGVYRPKTKDRIWLLVDAVPELSDDGSVNQVVCTFIDISERKQAEEALHRSEQLYHQMFDEHSAVKLLLDPADGRIVQANPSAAKFYGYSINELQEMYMDQISIYSREQILPAMRMAMQKESNHFIFQHRLASGDIRDIEIYSTPIQVTGRVLLYSIMHDITERRQAEKALEESEQRFRKAIVYAPFPAMLHAEDGRVEFINEQWEKITGYSSEEIPTISEWTQKAYGTKKELVHADIEKLYGITDKLDEGEYVVATKNGEKRNWYFSSTSLGRTIDGRRLFISMALDITERKKSEQITQLRLELLEFASTHSLDEFLIHALDEVEQATESQVSFYHFVEVDQKTLSLQAWSTRTLNEFCKMEGKGLHYEIDQAGVWVDCVYQRKPVIHNDYASLPNRKGLPSDHAKVIRELVVPIFREGKVVSILGVGNKPSDYQDSDVETVSFLADVTWEIVQRKRAEENLHEANAQLEKQLTEIEKLQSELKEQAFRDPLTGLHNRRYLSGKLKVELDHCIQEGENLSVIAMDIDHFKKINDRYGHQVGDMFLEAVAGILRDHIRGSDIACRYGGEEFLLVLPGAALPSAAKRAEELRERCADIRIQHEGKMIGATMSFGVAAYPQHGMEAEGLLIKADKALYKSKWSGRNRVTVWTEKHK